MSNERENAANETPQHGRGYSKLGGKRQDTAAPIGASYSPKVISGDTLRDDIRTAYGGSK